MKHLADISAFTNIMNESTSVPVQNWFGFKKKEPVRSDFDHLDARRDESSSVDGIRYTAQRLGKKLLQDRKGLVGNTYIDAQLKEIDLCLHGAMENYEKLNTALRQQNRKDIWGPTRSLRDYARILYGAVTAMESEIKNLVFYYEDRHALHQLVKGKNLLTKKAFR